ncbi:hypothetical protein [Streptomyces sp. x-80]
MFDVLLVLAVIALAVFIVGRIACFLLTMAVGLAGLAAVRRSRR